MKRFLNPRILMLTLTVLFAAIAVGAVERPFSANGRGIAVMSVDSNGVVSADVTGSGNATHLGVFTNVGKVYFNLDPSNPTVAHPTGEAIFTAADGDKLRVVVQDGSADLITGLGSGHFRFDGGTGRFANATGITSYVVEQNFVTGAYEITLVGNLDY